MVLNAHQNTLVTPSEPIIFEERRKLGRGV